MNVRKGREMNGKASECQEVKEDEREGRLMARRESEGKRMGREMNGKAGECQEVKEDEREGR